MNAYKDIDVWAQLIYNNEDTPIRPAFWLVSGDAHGLDLGVKPGETQEIHLKLLEHLNSIWYFYKC